MRSPLCTTFHGGGFSCCSVQGLLCTQCCPGSAIEVAKCPAPSIASTFISQPSRNAALFLVNGRRRPFVSRAQSSQIAVFIFLRVAAGGYGIAIRHQPRNCPHSQPEHRGRKYGGGDLPAFLRQDLAGKLRIFRSVSSMLTDGLPNQSGRSDTNILDACHCMATSLTVNASISSLGGSPLSWGNNLRAALLARHLALEDARRCKRLDGVDQVHIGNKDGCSRPQPLTARGRRHSQQALVSLVLARTLN